MILVLPVAGKGTRLRPHTLITPKPLLKIAGKTIISHAIDSLIHLPVEKILLVVGTDGNGVFEYVKESYKIPVDFVVQEKPLGLGHAIYVALEKIKENKEVLILLGDTILKADLKNFDENFIGLSPVDNPSRFGVAVCEGERIVRLVEKPKEFISNLAIAGIYFFKDSKELKKAIKETIDKNIKTKDEYQLTDAIQILLEKGAQIRKQDIKLWLDCGTQSALLESQREILKQRNENRGILKNSLVIPPVYIEDNTLIKDSVIGPFVSVGKNSRIEHSLIRDSIIGENTEIYNLNITSSLIGNNAKIEGEEKELNISDFSQGKI